MTDVKLATHHDYNDGAMPEREEQAAGDWKLSEADESPGRVVDGADLGLNKEEPGVNPSITKYSTYRYEHRDRREREKIQHTHIT